MTNEQQLAAFTLDLVRGATARCDDVTQQNVATSKQWLDAMVRGVIVTIPVVELQKLQASAKDVDVRLSTLRAERAARSAEVGEQVKREVEGLIDVSSRALDEDAAERRSAHKRELAQAAQLG